MSLIKRSQVQARNKWAAERNPLLDRKVGPAEIMPGLTWRSVLKFSGFIIGMSYIIGYANKKAYLKHEEAKRGTTMKHTQATKQILKTPDDTELAPSNFRHELISMKGKGKMDYEMKKIPRPDDGLTIENLRETSMGWKPANKSSGILGDMLNKLR
eukprot:TRINITY_DN17416_c0_g1_i1.p1 TRINITY_DN17416_c0_g1~~TRINITY_DN17416_c0_g1_i1.p1  ORF type:complete len:167 (+),score=19.84 TRINITY_DN17416_c0_g1_i1:35-502(+)